MAKGHHKRHQQALPRLTFSLRACAHLFAFLLCFGGTPAVFFEGRQEPLFDSLKKEKSFKIFDAFQYNGESHILFTRLWTLNPYVDVFVIFISPTSHSGAKRNISFAPLENEINWYRDKIEIINEDIDSINYKFHKQKYSNSSSISWKRENSQRDGLIIGVNRRNPKKGDLIINSDLDEIPTREAMDLLISDPPTDNVVLRGSYHMYNYCYITKEAWNLCVIAPWKAKMKNLNLLRNHAYAGRLTFFHPEKVLCRHCTYCFYSIDQFIQKLSSFAHREYSTKFYTSPDYIFRSHYCKAPIVGNEMLFKVDNLSSLEIPPDLRFQYLVDPNIVLEIDKTSYKPSDLNTLCVNQST